MTFRTTDIHEHIAAETSQDDPWSRYAWEIAQAEASQHGDSQADLWNPPETTSKRSRSGPRVSAKARHKMR